MRVSADLPVYYDQLDQSERRRVREEYITLQKGNCCHCGTPLTGDPAPEIRKARILWSLFPRGRGFLDHPIHLHHNRTTGLTIGAVHALCNAYLWQYKGE